MRINSKKNFFTPGSLISNTLLSFYFIFKWKKKKKRQSEEVERPGEGEGFLAN
jgi:hypothetical protein